MVEHLSDTQLQHYLAGELQHPETVALEAHVESCADCAAKLRHEASVEMKLMEVAELHERRRRRQPWLRAGMVAAAAGVFFALWSLLNARHESTLPQAKPQKPEAAPAVCVAHPERCRNPLRHGLVDDTRPEGMTIPRYENMAPHSMASDESPAGPR